MQSPHRELEIERELSHELRDDLLFWGTPIFIKFDYRKCNFATIRGYACFFVILRGAQGRGTTTTTTTTTAVLGEGTPPKNAFPVFSLVCAQGWRKGDPNTSVVGTILKGRYFIVNIGISEKWRSFYEAFLDMFLKYCNFARRFWRSGSRIAILLNIILGFSSFARGKYWFPGVQR